LIRANEAPARRATARTVPPEEPEGQLPQIRSRQSLLRRIRFIGAKAGERGLDAGQVVGTLLGEWCQQAFSALPAPSLPHSAWLAQQPSTIQFVAVLRSMPFLEASYWLASVYSVLVDAHHRRHLAMFFTPASLTEGLLNDLVEQGVDFANHSFFDPACGGAAFLAPIAQRMKAGLRRRGLSAKKILQHIEANLYGTDVDPVLCELSRHFLLMTLQKEILVSKWVPSFRVQHADALRDLSCMFETVDVVVCNPPYRKMVAEELDDLRESFADVLQAQPNLYGVFFGLCVRLLRPGGHAALVTPTSFLSGQYFSRLREFLLANTDVCHIGMVSDRQGVFIDVEQETSLTVLRRRPQKLAGSARSQVSVVSAEGRYRGVGECVLPGDGKAWPIPRAVPDVPLLKAYSDSSFRLHDYGYKVRIGAYVWNRDTRPHYASIDEVRKAGVENATPLVWSRDITVGGFVDFDAGAGYVGERRFVDLGDRHHTSVVRRPAVILQRVTSNDQPRRLVAAPVPASIYEQFEGFVGENHIVILEQQPRSAFSPAEMAQLLSTEPVDRYFRCISGATNVSAFELRQLALPDPARVRHHLNRGLSMSDAVWASLGLQSEHQAQLAEVGV